MGKDASDNLPPFDLRRYYAPAIVDAMSTLEIGVATLLLHRAWANTPSCTLSNDPALLPRWARVSAAEWAECGAVVVSAFTLSSDGKTLHLPLARALQLRAEKDLERSIEGGRAGAAKRWGGHSPPNAPPIRPPNTPPTGTPIAPPSSSNPRSKARIQHPEASASQPRTPIDKPSEASQGPKPTSARAMYEAARSRIRMGAAKTLLHTKRFEWAGDDVKPNFHSKLIADIMAKEPDVALVWWLLSRADDERPNDPVGWVTAGLQGKWPKPPDMTSSDQRDFEEWWESSSYSGALKVEMKRAGFNV